MEIKIKKIETFTIVQSTPEFTFEMDEFRKCTPAFIGKKHEEFMDYITNDIDDLKEFLLKNDDILCKSTKNSLYLLDVVPAYQIEEDSRVDYEDSWFVMEKQLEEKDGISINVSSEDSIN